MLFKLLFVWTLKLNLYFNFNIKLKFRNPRLLKYFDSQFYAKSSKKHEKIGLKL